jgi:hypothetical protein
MTGEERYLMFCVIDEPAGEVVLIHVLHSARDLGPLLETVPLSREHGRGRRPPIHILALDTPTYRAPADRPEQAGKDGSRPGAGTHPFPRRLD